MKNGDVAVKGGKTDKTDKADEAADKALKPRRPEVSSKPADVETLPAKAGGAVDCTTETAVLLDSIIHDLRTPLSAMSGWLEVLEAHFGEADGIVGRALLGLRRGVDSQTLGLSGLSDVLMKQRIDLPAQGECTLLERLRLALEQMGSRPESALDPAMSARLEAFRTVDPAGSLTCQDAGTSLSDACATLLQALVTAQGETDSPMSITANADKVLITVPGGSGDPTAIRSLCVGLAGYPTRRPEIRAQALWLARSMFRRCGLALQMSPAGGGGFHLLLSKAQLS